MANIGDSVRVKTKSDTYEGILMPRSELADDEHIVVKLKSGYNIGISKSEIVKIEKTGSAKQKEKSPVKFDKSKPPISLISTGGTISSKVDYRTGGVFPLSSPEDLLNSVPKLGDYVKISKISNPFNLLSEDMSPAEWIKIAKEVYSELKTDSQGVIVTHGTDTLHYTSAALSFMIKNPGKPIAVVGAQRSADRGSFDGSQNLLCAAHYCLSDIAEVAIVMHGKTDDDYCIASRGTKVRKMHSSRRDAFRPINESAIAKIYPDGNFIISNPNYNIRSDTKPELNAKFEEKTALIYAYPGSTPELLNFYAEQGYKGVIIAGTGFGHVVTQPVDKKHSWLDAIKQCIGKGMFVGITTQTFYGTTDPFVYSAGRLLHEAGCVYLKDMLPETAYVKLGWVLAHTTKPEEVKNTMLTNYAGEISERIEPDIFLY